MTQAPTIPPPSGRTLATATVIAIVAAAVVLVVAVLPAEYGVDPLGTGRALGLLNLFHAEEEAPPAAIAPSGAGPVYLWPSDYRVDTREFRLSAYQTIEFKYQLAKGATMIYEWKANVPLEFDFHTEPEGKPSDASDSFEKGRAAESRGGYTAPYAGIHGWYWENVTKQDAVITLKSAGFYSTAKLFTRGEVETIEIP